MQKRPVMRWQDFYPRPPRGGRPYFVYFWCTGGCISIHALREEGDDYVY